MSDYFGLDFIGSACFNNLAVLDTKIANRISIQKFQIGFGYKDFGSDSDTKISDWIQIQKIQTGFGLQTLTIIVNQSRI